jgi:hypothetical protein
MTNYNYLSKELSQGADPKSMPYFDELVSKPQRLDELEEQAVLEEKMAADIEAARVAGEATEQAEAEAEAQRKAEFERWLEESRRKWAYEEAGEAFGGYYGAPVYTGPGKFTQARIMGETAAGAFPSTAEVFYNYLMGLPEQKIYKRGEEPQAALSPELAEFWQSQYMPLYTEWAELPQGVTLEEGALPQTTADIARREWWTALRGGEVYSEYDRVLGERDEYQEAYSNAVAAEEDFLRHVRDLGYGEEVVVGWDEGEPIEWEIDWGPYESTIKALAEARTFAEENLTSAEERLVELKGMKRGARPRDPWLEFLESFDWVGRAGEFGYKEPKEERPIPFSKTQISSWGGYNQPTYPSPAAPRARWLTW